MALRFLGKDPDSPDGGSPTVYYDDERDSYVLQGWRVLDGRRAQLDRELLERQAAQRLQLLARGSERRVPRG